MDLTALYNLRERLKTSAIAGTGLIDDDFRLKKAVESFEPLESMSPVFSKIYQLSKAVIDKNCSNKPEMLLDALSLLDAVICVQSSAKSEGTLKDFSVINWTSAVSNAPYSIAAGVIEALTSSGTGHFSFVVDAHNSYPEIFNDYRIKFALIKALGASYSELADLAEKWLKEDGDNIVPILKKDFDPKGKKEMLKRINLIEDISGENENDFYLSQLEEAERDVKLALIYALRHTEQNTYKLIDISKTEKGKAKEMALWAMSNFNNKEAWEYLSKYAKNSIKYTAMSNNDMSNKIAADAFKNVLKPFLYENKVLNKEAVDNINEIVSVFPGKSGVEICGCYRLSAYIGDKLDVNVEGLNGNAWINTPIQLMGKTNLVKFSKAMPVILMQSIMVNPSSDIMQLAIELYDNGKRPEYVQAVIISQLFNKNSYDFYNWIKSLNKNIKIEYILNALSYLYWNDNKCSFVIKTSQLSRAENKEIIFEHNILENLDEHFYDLLIAYGNLGKSTADFVLNNWIQPKNKELCQKLGEYFYKKALSKNDYNLPYLDYMKSCKWTKCEGLALNYYKYHLNKKYPWALINFVRNLPGTNKERAEEVKSVLCEIENDSKSMSKYNKDYAISCLNIYINELCKNEN